MACINHFLSNGDEQRRRIDQLYAGLVGRLWDCGRGNDEEFAVHNCFEPFQGVSTHIQNICYDIEGKEGTVSSATTDFDSSSAKVCLHLRSVLLQCCVLSGKAWTVAKIMYIWCVSP